MHVTKCLQQVTVEIIKAAVHVTFIMSFLLNQLFSFLVHPDQRPMRTSVFKSVRDCKGTLQQQGHQYQQMKIMIDQRETHFTF